MKKKSRARKLLFQEASGFFVVNHGFARVAFMLKEQVLLHLPVVTVFYGYMLQDGYEAHLPAFQLQTSWRTGRRMPS